MYHPWSSLTDGGLYDGTLYEAAYLILKEMFKKPSRHILTMSHMPHVAFNRHCSILTGQWPYQLLFVNVGQHFAANGGKKIVFDSDHNNVYPAILNAPDSMRQNVVTHRG